MTTSPAATVFVHGVPETARIWGPFVAEMPELTPTFLSPPGFGAPVPTGFDPHPDSYATWMVEEIEALGGPVDLVGHDWGSGHVARLVADRPDLVRTWAIDCAGLLDPDYIWHDTAQIWQTEGAGEEAIGLMVGLSTDELTAVLHENGTSPELSRVIAEGIDEEMGRCILGLYRGGSQPYLADLGARLAGQDSPPGLALTATDDAYIAAELSRRAAEKVGMTNVDLDGGSHWWVETHGRMVADVLRKHWSAG